MISCRFFCFVYQMIPARLFLFHSFPTLHACNLAFRWVVTLCPSIWMRSSMRWCRPWGHGPWHSMAHGQPFSKPLKLIHPGWWIGWFPFNSDIFIFLYLFIYLSTYLSIYLAIYLSILYYIIFYCIILDYITLYYIILYVILLIILYYDIIYYIIYRYGLYIYIVL
jgi:hypothetical protein